MFSSKASLALLGYFYSATSVCDFSRVAADYLPFAMYAGHRSCFHPVVFIHAWFSPRFFGLPFYNTRIVVRKIQALYERVTHLF
jgi:hypothetical protein